MVAFISYKGISSLFFVVNEGKKIVAALPRVASHISKMQHHD